MRATHLENESHSGVTHMASFSHDSRPINAISTDQLYHRQTFLRIKALKSFSVFVRDKNINTSFIALSWAIQAIEVLLLIRILHKSQVVLFSSRCLYPGAQGSILNHDMISKQHKSRVFGMRRIQVLDARSKNGGNKLAYKQPFCLLILG